MNTSDSEEEVCNERTALVQSQSPSVPNYNRDPGLNPHPDGEPKRVSYFSIFFSVILIVKSDLGTSLAMCIPRMLLRTVTHAK